jgi:hypothetical protein
MTLRILFILVFAWAGLNGQDKPAAKSESKENVSGERRIIGPDGKRYILRQTPVGVAKVEEKEEKAGEKAEEPPDDMRAVEQGDSVQFERQTPVGVARWVRKKSELNEMEKAAWERERRRLADKASAKEAK